MLDELLYGSWKKSSAPYAVIDYDYIHRELSKKGVMLTLLWQEYCEAAYANGEAPYMSTRRRIGILTKKRCCALRPVGM